jgi:hypothetical protein
VAEEREGGAGVRGEAGIGKTCNSAGKGECRGEEIRREEEG